MDYKQIALSKKLVIGVNDEDFRKKYGDIAYQRVKDIILTNELSRQGLLSPNPRPSKFFTFLKNIKRSVTTYFRPQYNFIDLTKEHVSRIRKIELTEVKEIPKVRHPEQEGKTVSQYKRRYSKNDSH